MARFRWWLTLALAAALSACAPEGAPQPQVLHGSESENPALGALVQPVRGSSEHLKVAEPGPPPLESPRRFVLWVREGAVWRPGARVLDVALAGRALLSPEGVLSIDGKTVAERAYPPLVEAADGRLAFAAGTPPESDVYVWAAGETTRRTTDTYSDRPTWLPDGSLLWVSGAGGVVGFVHAGRRLTNLPGHGPAERQPVPAYAARTEYDAELDAVRFHAGTGWFALDVASGQVKPMEGQP
jgi:hypothetical protein